MLMITTGNVFAEIDIERFLFLYVRLSLLRFKVKCKVANICGFRFTPDGGQYSYRVQRVNSCIHSGVWSSGMILASGFSRPFGYKCERPWVRIPAHPDADQLFRAGAGFLRLFFNLDSILLSPKFSFTSTF